MRLLLQLAIAGAANLPLLVLSAIRNRWGLEYLDPSGFAQLLVLLSASSFASSLMTGGISLSLAKGVSGQSAQRQADIHIATLYFSAATGLIVALTTWMLLSRYQTLGEGDYSLIMIIACFVSTEVYRSFFSALDISQDLVLRANLIRGAGAMVAIMSGPALCEHLGARGFIGTMLIPNLVIVVTGIIRYFPLLSTNSGMLSSAVVDAGQALFRTQRVLYLSSTLGSLSDLIVRAVIRSRFGDLSLVNFNLALSIYSAVSTLASSAGASFALRLKTGGGVRVTVGRLLTVSTALVLVLYAAIFGSLEYINHYLLLNRTSLTTVVLVAALLLNIGQNINWIFGARAVVDGTQWSILLVDLSPVVARSTSLLASFLIFDWQLILYSVASAGVSLSWIVFLTPGTRMYRLFHPHGGEMVQ